MKACRVCQSNDPTVAYRERMPKGLAVLCAACHVDVRTSSTRKVAVPEREQQDRYAQMAVRYGVK
jgi:hypothetical protein